MEELRSLADLLDLQAVDLEIDRLLELRGSLPELEAYRSAHEETIRLRRARDEAQERLTATTRELDRVTGELGLVEEKAEREQNRLYAGGLSARDADYLRREVEMLRGRISDMEEQALELMERRELEEAEVQRLSEELVDAERERSRLEELISEEWRRIDAEIAAKEARKAEIVPLVDPELLSLYEDLRSRREGAVVGTLVGRVCGVCHLQLSAAEEVEALASRPPRCLHCRAILVP